jgi:hypothetical protein
MVRVRSVNAPGESGLARPICLVQFEQRSRDNFAVRFRVRWTNDLKPTDYCPIPSDFGFWPVEMMKQARKVGGKKRQ